MPLEHLLTHIQQDQYVQETNHSKNEEIDAKRGDG